MANIYGVCPERAAQHKGYSDFVQHTNPLKEGLLRLSISGAQTLRNSLGCVQIKLGEMLSLKLKADNSLIGLISVREPELVNPLIQLNYRESRELANSLIQLNSVDSTESDNSLIMSKTCIAGTSPNVLMKSDASHLPSRDGTQKAQKEKGSVRSAALWDDCSFNHEENHYSTDLDNNADLRLYGTLSPAQTLHTEIIGTQNLQVVKSYSQNNPEIIGAVHSANDISSAQPFGSLQLSSAWSVAFFVFCISRSAASAIPIPSSFVRCPISAMRTNWSIIPARVSSSVPPIWRRAISPRMAVTINPALLSPSRFTESIPSNTSCGIRTVVICDLAFLYIDMVNIFSGICISLYTKKRYKNTCNISHLQCNVYLMLCCLISHNNKNETPQCANTCGAPNHNVTGANTMAFTHSTQTRPKFTYLFLGTPSDLPTCTPTVLRAEADTEEEARAKFIDWDLTFAAQIRTAAPSRLQLFSTDDGFMWIYEQRQEASHA